MFANLSLPLRTKRLFGDDERAFLPAALEILESPPSPLGRAMALALCLVTVSALGWATIGRVDIVAVANGKIVSHLRTQVVQPFETSSVDAILVAPDQQVRAGQPLIELDKTAALAERDHATKDLASASLDQMRLTAFLDGATVAPFGSVVGASAQDIARAQAELTTQIAQRASQIANLTQEKAEKQADRDLLVQTDTKLGNTIPMVAARAEIREKAAEIGYASIIAKLEAEQQLAEAKGDLAINNAKIVSLEAAINGLDQKIAAAQAEIRTTAMTELSKAQDKIRSAREALSKAERRANLQTLRAPIEGTVQQLHVVSIGSVVTPAQQLLSIVPKDDQIEIEAELENRDIGFVKTHQNVELKIDAFPFTRYGLLRGKVLSVDRDAEVESVNQNTVQGSQRPADTTENVDMSERLRYTVRIKLEPGSLDVDGHPANLVPGMSVKAEILTGRRRIIDFILAPLREHIHDAFRER